MSKNLSTFQYDQEQLQISQKDFIVKPAQDFLQFYQACRLVYDEYHSSGLCATHPSKLRFYLRELLPESTTFVCIYNNRVIASITGIRWSIASLPAYSVYKSEIDRITQSSGLFIEATKFASVARKIPGFSANRDPIIVLESLLGILFHWSGCVGADFWLSVVHPKQVSYYTKKFGFKVVGHEKNCDHVSNKPGVLIQMNVRDVLKGRTHVKSYFKDKVLFPYPSITQVQNYHFLSAVEVLFLLLEQPEVLDLASEEELKIFNFYYPDVVNLVKDYYSKYTYDFSKNSTDVSAVLDALGPLFKIEAANGLLLMQNYQFDFKLLNDFRVFEIPAFFDYMNLIASVFAKINFGKFNLVLDVEVPKLVCGKKFVLMAIIAALISASEELCYLSLNAIKRKHDSLILKFQWRTEKNLFPEAILSLLSLVNGSIWTTQSKDGYFIHNFTFPLLDLKQDNIQFNTIESNLNQVDRNLVKSPSILIAEANVLEQAVLLRLLNSRGYQIKFVKSGREALEIYNSEEFDLFIVDSALPEIDGLTVAKLIKNEQSSLKVPILLITSWVDERQVDNEHQFVDDVIRKPLNINDFFQKLDYHLAHSYISREKTHFFRVA